MSEEELIHTAREADSYLVAPEHLKALFRNLNQDWAEYEADLKDCFRNLNQGWAEYEADLKTLFFRALLCEPEGDADELDATVHRVIKESE